jgi:hypothetical protein
LKSRQYEIPLSFNGIDNLAVAVPFGYSKIINAVKRQRNLGLYEKLLKVKKQILLLCWTGARPV